VVAMSQGRPQAYTSTTAVSRLGPPMQVSPRIIIIIKCTLQVLAPCGR
jgi:hypothetical protein